MMMQDNGEAVMEHAAFSQHKYSQKPLFVDLKCSWAISITPDSF
jgi:hypothetical protein